MRNLIFSFAMLACGLKAQPTVAPTPEPVGPPRGENAGTYNVLNSFELGYRFRAVGGDLGKYRSDVNFGNGIKLLGSRLQMNSRDGRGRFFDELTLTTQGIGGDPYQSSILRLEKNKLYRYDMSWRLAEYFNPGLRVSEGLHALNTSRRFQDHDFTLFPQSAFKLFAGYTRNSQDGPGLSTIQIFDSRGDEFPLFTEIRRQRNEYRLGGEATLAGFTLNVLKGWDNWKDDSLLNVNQRLAGASTTDNTTLSTFRRNEPYHGNSPYWRLFLNRNSRRFGMNARYSNVSGRRDFVVDELTLGTDRLAAARNRQILVLGNGSRPVSTANLNLAFHPTARLTVTNHTGFHHTRMNGDSAYTEIDNNTTAGETVNFSFLGIRTIETLSDVSYAVSKTAGLYGGYHYSTRRIRSRQGQSFDGFAESQAFEQDNRVHSGLAGLRLRPMKALTIQLDGELGRANRPFFPISEKNYHALNARARYRSRVFSASAQARTFYNTNSTTLFSHSSFTRQYSFDGSYTPRGWLSVDAGYTKIHLDTNTGIAYFAASQLHEGNRSIYISNLHTGYFGARLVLGKRADLYLGYSIVRDLGDGRSASSVIPLYSQTTVADASPVFLAAQTFPLSYQAPLARLSIRLHEKLRWNVGYQHYSYHEDFAQVFYQNYRAHTGYVSLLWSF